MSEEEILPMSKANQTATIFPELVRLCENSLKAMPVIENKIVELQKEEKAPFSPSEAFVLSYFAGIKSTCNQPT